MFLLDDLFFEFGIFFLPKCTSHYLPHTQEDAISVRDCGKSEPNK